MNRALAALLVGFAVIIGCSAGPVVGSPAAASPRLASAPPPPLTRRSPEASTRKNALATIAQRPNRPRIGVQTRPLGGTRRLEYGLADRIDPAYWPRRRDGILPRQDVSAGGAVGASSQASRIARGQPRASVL